MYYLLVFVSEKKLHQQIPSGSVHCVSYEKRCAIKKIKSDRSLFKIEVCNNLTFFKKIFLNQVKSLTLDEKGQ